MLGTLLWYLYSTVAIGQGLVADTIDFIAKYESHVGLRHEVLEHHATFHLLHGVDTVT